MKKGIQILIAIIPPDAPGTSARLVYDPDITSGLLAYEVGQAVTKQVKRLTKPKKEKAAPVG